MKATLDTEVVVEIAVLNRLVLKADAWNRMSNALDVNRRDECSAGDVAAAGFSLQEELAAQGLAA